MCKEETFLERYEREWKELTPEQRKKVQQLYKRLGEMQDPTLLEKRLKEK